MQNAFPFPPSFTYQAVELMPAGPTVSTHTLPTQVDTHSIVVKPLMVGICRSDLKEVMGNRPARSDFGHEIVGTIEWASSSLPFLQGDLVCFNPNVGVSRTSGFGEKVIAEGDAFTIAQAFPKITLTLPPEKLVFCEPLACAQHCIANTLRYLERTDLQGLRVAVVGAGNTGTMIGLIAKYLGATLTVFNRRNERLHFLEERRVFLGEELEVLNNTVVDAFDVLIPTTTFLYSPVLAFVTRAVQSEGLIVLFGGTQEGDVLPRTGLDINLIRRQQRLARATFDGKVFSIGGTYGATFEDFAKVMEYLQASPARFPVEHLIVKEISLDALPMELQRLASPETNYYGKIVVRFP
jgi:cyclitol reductase